MLKIRSFLRNKKGISNVIGTMLLVVVVVVAVSGFAVVVSEIQKKESERLGTIAAVESEILKITHIDPVISGTNLEALDFTLLNLNSRDARIVSVIINDRSAGNFTSTDDYNNPDNFNFYNRLTLLPGTNKVIHIDFTNESYFNPAYNLSITEPLEITVFTSYANNFKKLFTPPKPVIKTSVETESVGAVERDVLVLDGSDSYDDGSIKSYNWLIRNSIGNITLLVSANCTNDSAGNWSYCCNDSYANWTSGPCHNFTDNGTYTVRNISVWNYTSGDIIHNFTGKKEKVILNQSGPFYVSLTVVDDTNMVGVSDVTIPENMKFNPQTTPPTAVIIQSIETEDLGVAYRDVLVLDGSKSYDDGSIIDYGWLITNDTGDIIQNVTGKKIRVILSQTGPFYVNLTVTDDTGSGDTEQVRTPKNMNFNPPVSMSASTGGSSINVIVNDINSNPYAGAAVYFIRMSGNVTFSPSSGVTGTSGTVSTTTSGEGIIQARSGNLNPIDIAVT